MRFYGNGAVWDKEKNQTLCKFVKGIFDTTDQRTSDILLGLGYRADSEIVHTIEEEDIISVDFVEESEIKMDSPDTVSDNLSEEEIKELAKSNKIKSWHLKSIDKLVEELIELGALNS